MCCAISYCCSKEERMAQRTFMCWESTAQNKTAASATGGTRPKRTKTKHRELYNIIHIIFICALLYVLRTSSASYHTRKKPAEDMETKPRGQQRAPPLNTFKYKTTGTLHTAKPLRTPFSIAHTMPLLAKQLFFPCLDGLHPAVAAAASSSRSGSPHQILRHN